MYKTLVHCQPIWPAAQNSRVVACLRWYRLQYHHVAASEHAKRISRSSTHADAGLGDRGRTFSPVATMCPLPNGCRPNISSLPNDPSRPETSVGLTIAQSRALERLIPTMSIARIITVGLALVVESFLQYPQHPLFDARELVLAFCPGGPTGVGQESKQQPCERFRLKALQPAPPAP